MRGLRQKQLRFRQMQTEKMPLAIFISHVFGNFMYNLLIQRQLLNPDAVTEKISPERPKLALKSKFPEPCAVTLNYKCLTRKNTYF